MIDATANPITQPSAWHLSRDLTPQEEFVLRRLDPDEDLRLAVLRMAEFTGKPVSMELFEAEGLRCLTEDEPGIAIELMTTAHWPTYAIGSDHPLSHRDLGPEVTIAAIGRTRIDGRRCFVGQVIAAPFTNRHIVGDVVASALPWKIRNREGAGSRGVWTLRSPASQMRRAEEGATRHHESPRRALRRAA